MNEVTDCINARRSIRLFKSNPITEGALQEILAAGVHAPSAGNLQSPLIVICENSECNKTLGHISRMLYLKEVGTDSYHVSDEQPSIADDDSLTDAFYSAPVVVTLFGPKEYAYTAGDCYAMAENMMIAATSLGIGSCLVSRAKLTFKSASGREYARKWNIPDDYEAVIHVAFGHPLKKSSSSPAYRENRILRIR